MPNTQMNADELAIALAAKYPEWNLWRTVRGGFCVQVHPNHNVDGDTLSEALAKALEYKVLPRARKRPALFAAADCVPYKSGNRWRLERQGRDIGVELATKKAAVECAERFERQSREAIRDWEAWMEGKQHGVDFMWEGE